MNILQSLCLGLYMIFANFTFQKGTYPIDLTFTMTKSKIIPTHLNTFWSLVTNSKLWTTGHKVPCFSTFELCRTNISPNQMLFWKTSFVFHITPMQNESVLHKEAIMCFVITYVLMDLLQHFRALKVCSIILNIHFIGYVHQDSDLHVVPMHVLHFIMSFECVVF